MRLIPTENRMRVPFEISIRKNGKVEKVRVQVSALRDDDGEALFDEATFTEIAQAKADALGVLGPREFKQLRRRLGVTQARMGLLLICGAKTYTRWETGRSLPHPMVSELIRFRFSQEFSPGIEQYLPIHAEIKIDGSPPGLIKICLANGDTRSNALKVEGVLVLSL